MRTLWDALDEDQWRKLRVAWAVVGVMLGFVIGAIGLVRGTRTLGTLAEVSIALACIGIFPLLRRSAERKLPEELGARRVSSESFPKSFSEAASASLAGGAAKAPAFSVIEHGNVNGFVKGSLSAPHFLVTTAFLHLPLAEQRAGFALLLGRLKADPMVFIAAQEMRQADRPTGGDYAGSLTQDQAALSPEELWTEIAAAADREGLMILKEPEPIIALLERLAATDTSMGRSVSPAGSYRFLAYPASKRLRSGDALPAAAAEALATSIRNERSDRPGSRYAMNSEATRSERLQDVTGVVGFGALVDSMQGAATHRLAPTGDVRMSVARAEGAVSVEAAASLPQVRISKTCPTCGAGNVPTNTRCIACDAAMAV